MEQPLIYNNEDELIDWLLWDLEEQKNKGVAEDKLVLNIGNRDKITKVEIKFNFYFNDIISKLPNIKKDEYEKYTCPYKVDCIRVTFGKLADFNRTTFGGEADFSSAKFDDRADFSDAKFVSWANFFSATFGGEADFRSAKFGGLANFKCINFKEKTFFKKSTFNSKVLFGLSNGKEGTIAPTTFTKEVTFERAVFEGEADFKYVVFNEKANFTFTIFKGEADFKYAKVKNDIIFDNTSLYERGAFWKIEIDNHILTFENIKLSDKSNIYFGGIKNKEITIKIVNTVINGRVDFNNVKIKQIDFKGSNIMGAGVLNRIKFEAECENWETATILKHEEIKRNNTIKALEYKAIEKDLYEKELIDKKDKSMQTWGEIASIKLSKLSNNHGQSWLQAVAFTLISGFFFFTLSQAFFNINIIQVMFLLYLSFILCGYMYYFCSLILDIFKIEEKHTIVICLVFVFMLSIFMYLLSIEFYINTPKDVEKNLSCFFKNYFNYLIPTNFDLIKNINGNIFNLIFFYIFYILGKIAIGYGMVEIVQAFRKLNSK